MPTTSPVPSATGIRGRATLRIAATASAPVASRGSMSISCRGVISARAVRSDSRITPLIISRSSVSSTPPSCASAKRTWTSSSVTRFSLVPRWPSSHSTTRPDRSRNHTSGAATTDNTVIAGAMRIATPSALRKAICFGTSSPTIRLT